MSSVHGSDNLLQFNQKLYNCLSLKDIDNLKLYFKNLKSRELNYENFRKLMRKYNVNYSDDEYKNVCLKIDLNRDSSIGWSEFISYFILELQNDDPTTEKKGLILPIAKPAQLVATTHKNVIIKTQFVPALLPDGSLNSSQGGYITVASDGVVCYWSANWKHERSVNADSIPETTSELIETSDKFQMKKSPKTLILDAIALPDPQIICISSVCCDLRFYDTSASKCNLKLYIRNFPEPLCKFFYYCSTGAEKNSKLIFGDCVGTVRVIDFAKNFKYNFRSGTLLHQLSYHQLMKGEHDSIKCVEYYKMHRDKIKQVGYIESTNSIISASESTISNKAYMPGVIIRNLGLQDTQIIFTMNSGTTCFAIDESTQTLATGGPDCILRLWDPIMPSKPKAIFSPGHNSGIMHLFMQDNASKVYTMDKKKIIKIWNVFEETLIQTFTSLKTVFLEDLPLTPYYNDLSREYIIVTKKIALLVCSPRIRLELTDGNTHMGAVTVILLNTLFNVIVTCGVDSMIIVWNPWTGRRINLFTKAHTRQWHGESVVAEITAGCFDAKHQFLLTGGSDGSLKVWNFNEGICLRNLKIDNEVTAVFWSNDRIFATGWDKIVTEFSDNNVYKDQNNDGKKWSNCNREEILCAAFHPPEAVATVCSSGDLVFWRFETGQPYMRYNVKYPKRRQNIIYSKGQVNMDDERMLELATGGIKSEERIDVGIYARKLSPIQLPEKLKNLTNVYSQSMLFLNTRDTKITTGSLLVAINDGNIQVWSHHYMSDRYITSFNAIHMPGDVITSMTTDTNNVYLFTGSALGYIKIWQIVNYCTSKLVTEQTSNVKLRTLFPFLWQDELEGRAKRSVKNQLEPLLLNSYQGHKKSISGLIYCDNQILISSSSDQSVRLWHLSGQYIGVLGSPIKWMELSSNVPPSPDYNYRLPPDLKREISYTTMKVLEGGKISSLMTRNIADKKLLDKQWHKEIDELCEVTEARPYRHLLKRPMIKKDIYCGSEKRFEKPILDISLPDIPIYSHLKIHPTVAISLPKSLPKCLMENENLQYLFLEPSL